MIHRRAPRACLILAAVTIVLAATAVLDAAATLDPAAVPIARDAAAAPTPQRSAVRVLFIGNSYTYYNNLPQILERLAASSPDGVELETTMVTVGGATLKDHWEGDAARAAIEESRWDYVVLQSQSTFGDTYLVEGLERVADDAGFVRYALLFAAAIEEAGARPVLFAHWKRRDAPARDQAALNAAFSRVARQTGALIAPIGLAWQIALQQRPSLRLYDDDGSHPSPAGSYLSACALYGILVEASPVGLAASASGNPVEEADGSVDPDSTRALVELSGPEATVLQTAAWNAIDRIHTDAEAFEATPPAIELPSLPEGQPFRADQITGEWAGEARHYPRWVTWPARMELRLRQADGRFTGELALRFGGQPEDVVRAVEVSLNGSTFEFTDPEGPNGGVVRYRGVFTGSTLAGVGEILVEDAPIYAIGSWSLERIRAP